MRVEDMIPLKHELTNKKTYFTCEICPNMEDNLCKRIGYDIIDYLPEWCPLWCEDVKNELH